MITEMQELTLFGGLAKVQTLNPIESGSLKTLENVTLLIGKQFITIKMKKRNEKLSYTWQENNEFPIVIKFNKSTFDRSFVWRTDYIKKMIFLTISVWGRLSQRKVVSALGASKNASSLSSISSNLEAGKRQYFYIKQGQKQDAIFELSENYLNSKQMRYVLFTPSLKAIVAVKERANELSKNLTIKSA